MLDAISLYNYGIFVLGVQKKESLMSTIYCQFSYGQDYICQVHNK